MTASALSKLPSLAVLFFSGGLFFAPAFTRERMSGGSFAPVLFPFRAEQLELEPVRRDSSEKNQAMQRPPAHRGARVIGTDALRTLVISEESSDGEGGDQDNKDNPNIDAHQSSPLPMVRARRYTEAKESPGQRFPGLSMK